MTLQEFIEDICLCGGETERRMTGGLSLLVCKNCGKAGRERALRAGDWERKQQKDASVSSSPR